MTGKAATNPGTASEASAPVDVAADEKVDPVWPGEAGQAVVFLIDASSALERRILEQWIERTRPPGVESSLVESIAIPPTRGRRRPLGPELEDRLAAGDDPLLAPLRIAWLPRAVNGIRTVRLMDVLTLSDPRDPGRLRQEWTWRWRPQRCRIVAGEPARAGQLRQRWKATVGADQGEATGLTDFVVRQATLALERAERRLRGARYKVPRLVDEDILGRHAFRGGLARLARSLGEKDDKVRRAAESYLSEIAATHSPFVIDTLAHLIRALYTRGYGENLHYDAAALEKIYRLCQRYPIVFLPTHKSNLDHLVLQYALHEHGHPPNHTAGGINMNFFPLGPLVRRSGVFFIRRSFKDNAVYKFVLHHYIDYLIEKRFSLEWYLEGGRSRSGKLLPPRFGLLAYVADAFQRGKADDVLLIPVAIAYDQIQEVGDYAAEQRGGQKQAESFGWLLRVVRKLGRRYGDIHLRFAEPISLRSTLGGASSAAPSADLAGAEPNPDERDLALQKLAFEVCVRINRVTPITPTSLVTLALLGAGDRAVTLIEVARVLGFLNEFVTRHGLPVTELLNTDDLESIRRVLEHLAENGVVACFDEGAQAVYHIGPDQHLAAAYYRNTIIHFFVGAAIGEVALIAAMEAEGDCEQAFWDEALALRDRLKFEFFFAPRDEFRSELAALLEARVPSWQERLRGGPSAVRELLFERDLFYAPLVLRPFLEAYQVVGDLVEAAGDEAIDGGRIVGRALALGKQYVLQCRVRSAESVSKILFQTALKLADNRDLLEVGEAASIHARREAFAAELRDDVRRIEAIDALAAGRRAGLVGSIEGQGTA